MSEDDFARHIVEECYDLERVMGGLSRQGIFRKERLFFYFFFCARLDNQYCIGR